MNTNTIDIKHKHAEHLLCIDGHSFKADHHGRWNLTDIWRSLGLPTRKQPGKWLDTKKAKSLEQTGNIGSINRGRAGSVTYASKRAALVYAGWVSDDFERMVYDAFEAILELPEVALAISEQMARMGNYHSADLLKRSLFNDKCDWKSVKRNPRNTQIGLSNAVRKGHISQARAEDLGLKVVSKVH